jgi:hypothetical protein
MRTSLAATIVALALVLPACGSDDEASAPPDTTTAAAAPTATTPAEPAPTATATDRPTKAENESDKLIEARRDFYLALDDQAIAFDDVMGRGLDGDPSADAALAKIRKRVTDLVYDYSVEGGDTTAGVTAFQGAIADAVSALNSSDQRKMVKARVAGQDARAEFAGDLIGP